MPALAHAANGVRARPSALAFRASRLAGDVPGGILERVRRDAATSSSGSVVRARRRARAARTYAFGGRGKETHEHVVRSGDTLWDIAMDYGVTVDALRAANGFRRDGGSYQFLYEGQEIRVPVTESNRHLCVAKPPPASATAKRAASSRAAPPTPTPTKAASGRSEKTASGGVNGGGGASSLSPPPNRARALLSAYGGSPTSLPMPGWSFNFIEGATHAAEVVAPIAIAGVAVWVFITGALKALELTFDRDDATVGDNASAARRLEKMMADRERRYGYRFQDQNDDVEEAAYQYANAAEENEYEYEDAEGDYAYDAERDVRDDVEEVEEDPNAIPRNATLDKLIEWALIVEGELLTLWARFWFLVHAWFRLQARMLRERVTGGAR